MTNQQRVFILKRIHEVFPTQHQEHLRSEFKYFNLPPEEIETEFSTIDNLYKNGIGNLNPSQLKNLITHVEEHGLNSDWVHNRLSFYRIDTAFHENIIQFLIELSEASKPIKWQMMDMEFRGIQLATRDDFNMLINQGWTGYWDLKPENIEPKRVQIASMNESGNFPRGCYLNADITDVKSVDYHGKEKYIIYFSNPVIINTGNLNVKFTENPVRYIK
jgi:hypothetical protein